MEENLISIIIPIYNESKIIEKTIEMLEPFKDKAEILFVDGGSTDDTLAKIPKGYKVINSPKGRAVQMNMGAKASSGNVLFFLHGDSELPSDAISEINRVMKEYDFGCFGIGFHTIDPIMKICQFISNHRIIDRKVVFGDQGIFIKRELFEKVGGFPGIPIMEDYEFSLRLKKLNIPIGRTKHKIYTSDRRFKPGRKLIIMWQMNRLRAMYRKGYDINILADMYKDVR
ncbi:MAG: TIGR04283 family arsenosugar biosynthesis glycosyltransferase [Lachnospiraceae bacterium]|jgi:rSAM/selenodomain-associated transferase 2|nr:TIGR04283 family arsenosugar biosynthesis glycosyltransferase [Lachnospiraceae bacterium]